jgi:hypothetical protein
MKEDEKFDIVLSKNYIARYIRDNCEDVPEYILFDFDEVEKRTGVFNQPTARNIITCKKHDL